MKTAKWSPLFILVLLLAAPKGSAQGGCPMIPNYSSYTDFSLDQNLDISSVVVVDGSTTLLGGGCGAMHQAQIYNMLGSTGGWAYGPTEAPATYISFTNAQDIVGQPGITYTDNTYAEIFCTIAGNFWNVPIIWEVKIGVANEEFYSSEPLPSGQLACLYSLNCPNGNSNCSCPGPAYLQYNVPYSCPTYLHIFSLVVNGKCFPVGVTSPAEEAVNCQ